jgi:glycerol-3-phosphate dehydrogenase subunit B
VSVAVIGGGIAGAAAAHELARHGQRATVFHAHAGQSALYSGALDFEPWDRVHELSVIAPELAQFSEALGIWQLGSTAPTVATLEGNLRPARGRDRALLDLESCAGKRVAVVDPQRDDWDALLLAKSFACCAWAKRTHTQFEAVRVRALQNNFERRTSVYDFAAAHDAPERWSFLLAALRSSGAAPDAWLFGPWLGVERPAAAELTASLGRPVGETTSAPGGTSGARFEAARDRLLSRVAEVKRARVARLEPSPLGFRIETEAGEVQDFSAVVLATGGVSAGGVALERSFDRRGGSGFRLSFSAPVALELDGEIVEGVSSLASIDFVERGLGALLKVGIAVTESGAARGAPGLFVAGDAVAGRPRTALLAAQSGLSAARRALEHVRSSE